MNDPTKIVIEHPESNAYVEYWLVLARHRLVFALVFSVCALFGLGFSLSGTDTYTYTSLIEIGMTTDGENVMPIETMESVATKLKDAYVPLARARIAGKLNGEAPPDVEIIPLQKNNYVITLRSQGPKEHAAIHQELHNLIFQTLKDEHRQLFDARSKFLADLLIKVDSKARALEDGERMVPYTNTIRLSHALANSSRTRMVAPPTQSLEPIRTNRRQATIISILLALVAGVLAVFLAEIAARTRGVMERRDTT